MSVMNPEKARDGLRVWLLALFAAAVGIAIAGSQVREAGAAVGTCTLVGTIFNVTEGDPVNITIQRTGGTETAHVGFSTTWTTVPLGNLSPSAGTIEFSGTTTSRVLAIHTPENSTPGDGGRMFEVEIHELVGPDQEPCDVAGNTTATVTITDDDGPQPPSITSLSKHSGTDDGGTPVTISGSHFTGVDCDGPDYEGVKFGGTNAASCAVTNDSTITAVTPPHAPGLVDVAVTNGVGPSPNTAADNFEFGAGPIVHDVSPATAPAGTVTSSIQITGEQLTGACPSGVKFNATVAASCVENSASSLTVSAPVHAIGDVDVRVTVGVNTSPDTVDDDFTFTGNVPVVTSVSPNSGPLAGGNTVTITGSFLTGANNVKFGTQNATNIVVAGNGNSLTVTVPTGLALGTVDVQVTTPSGSSSTAGANDDYTYTAAPTIAGLNPDEGPTGGGTQVIITGTNLFGVHTVTFGGINATAFTVNSGAQITATAPPHALGAVDVRVTNVSGTSPNTAADDYTYIGGPNITSVSPTGGPVTGGTVVQIKGSGFTGTTAVKFGTVDASSFTVVNDTTINATSPAHAKGVVHIRVTAPGGTSPEVDADRFTYGEPTVTEVSPNSGPKTGMNFVTIKGSNFTGATNVRFGLANSPVFDVTDDMTIVAQVPAGTGTVHVTVITPAGTSATHDNARYTYNALPTITGLSPSTGPVEGGNNVVITGSDFTGATNVLFGTKAAAGFTVNSDTRITAVAPSGTPGEVNVRVVSPKGTSPTSNATRYTYQGTGQTTVYNLSFRWNLVTWAGPNAIDIVVALQSLDGNSATNSIWEYVTAIYYWQTGGPEPSWLRFFPIGVNIPGANNLSVFLYGQAYWIALSQSINWTIPEGP